MGRRPASRAEPAHRPGARRARSRERATCAACGTSVGGIPAVRCSTSGRPRWQELDDDVARAVEILLRRGLQCGGVECANRLLVLENECRIPAVDVIAGEEAQPVTILTQTRFTLAQIGLADLLEVLVRHAVRLDAVDLGEHGLLQLGGTLGCGAEVDS